MSLEAALAENTAALKLLIAVLQSGAVIPTGETSTAPAPTTTKATRGKKTDTPAAGAAGNGATGADTPPASTTTGSSAGSAAGQGAVSDVHQGDEPLYVHIAANRTVAKIDKGQVIPSISGMVQITAAEYEALKAQYSPLPSGAAAAPSDKPAASPAAATPSASTASSTQPAASAATVDGPAITALCQALHKAQGNDGLLAVLSHFNTKERPVVKVSGLLALTDRYAEIAKFIDAKLNPQPAAEESLFG